MAVVVQDWRGDISLAFQEFPVCPLLSRSCFVLFCFFDHPSFLGSPRPSLQRPCINPEEDRKAGWRWECVTENLGHLLCSLLHADVETEALSDTQLPLLSPSLS